MGMSAHVCCAGIARVKRDSDKKVGTPARSCNESTTIVFVKVVKPNAGLPQ